MNPVPNGVSENNRGEMVDSHGGTAARSNQIKGEIDRTRAEMGSTVGEIEGRLNPTRLKQDAVEQFHDLKEKLRAEIKQELRDAKENVREATIGRVENMVHGAKDAVSDAGTGVMATLKANPIPAAMAGIGLAWLFMNARKDSGNDRARSFETSRRRYLYDYEGYGRPEDVQSAAYVPSDYRESEYRGEENAYGSSGEENRGVRSAIEDGTGRVGEAINGAQKKGQELTQDLRERASELRDKVGEFGDRTGQRIGRAEEQMREYAGRARNEMRNAEHYVEGVIRDNPIGIAAAAFAAGTALALALPHTQKEDQWMGQARDRLMERAGEAANTAVDKVQEAATQAVEKAGGGENPKAEGTQR